MTVHFLHVGKTGGTALRWAVERATSSGTRFGDVVTHPHGTRLADVPTDDAAVLFVRDPVTRFVSGFESRRRRGRPRFDNPWTKPEVLPFLRYRSAAALADALARRQRFARHAMRSVQHVNQPLVYWFGAGDTASDLGRDNLFIGRQEHLVDDVIDLSRFLGLEASLELPHDSVTAHRAPRPPKPLSAAGTAVLRDWYADDYSLLDRLFPGQYGTPTTTLCT